MPAQGSPLKPIRATATCVYDPQDYLADCAALGEEPTEHGWQAYVRTRAAGDFNGEDGIPLMPALEPDSAFTTIDATDTGDDDAPHRLIIRQGVREVALIEWDEATDTFTVGVYPSDRDGEWCVVHTGTAYDPRVD